MLSTDAAIAANRFGYGARPGELTRLGSHARDSLLAQTSAPRRCWMRRCRPRGSCLRRPIALREDARNDKAGGDAGLQSSTAIAGDKVGKLLREVFAPAYVADVVARARAAITTERDFLERLVQFWSNHFAVSVDKLVVLGLAGPLEREAIRPHVLGNFTSMLLAVEQHPRHAAVPGQPAVHGSGLAGRAAGQPPRPATWG